MQMKQLKYLDHSIYDKQTNGVSNEFTALINNPQTNGSTLDNESMTFTIHKEKQLSPVDPGAGHSSWWPGS